MAPRLTVALSLGWFLFSGCTPLRAEKPPAGEPPGKPSTGYSELIAMPTMVAACTVSPINMAPKMIARQGSVNMTREA